MLGIVTDKNADSAALARSATKSNRAMQPHRQNRTMFMRDLAGPYYGANASQVSMKMPLNLLYSIGSILEPLLAVRRIRTGVTSENPKVRWFGESFRVMLNHVARKINMAPAIREVIRDSLAGAGIIKTGYDRSAGKMGFFAEPVSLDDYIIDMRSKVRKPGSYAFEGHKFRMSYEKAMDGGLFGKDERGRVEQAMLRQSELGGDDKAETIGTGSKQYSEDDFEPQVELAEFYLPNRKGIVWMAGDLAESTHYLREFGWYGHDDGPFDMLGYTMLNDNPLPVPLYGVIYDLYILENILARKAARQAENQRDMAVTGKTGRDGETVRKSRDGEVLELDHPKEAKVLSIGGASEKGYQAIGYFHDWLNRISGNTEVVGGLRADEKTLGQSQIELGGASTRVNDMRGSVTDMIEAVIGKLGWYIWNDPSLKMTLTQRIAGGYQLPVTWQPGVRMGEFDDFEFSLSAYSRQSESPETKYDRIVKWVQQVVLPIAPLAAQQGSRLNVDVLANVTGRDLDLPEIDELWEESDPLPGTAPIHSGAATSAARGPALTTGRQPTRPIEGMAMQTQTA